MPAPGPGDAAGDAVLVERLRSDEWGDAMRALFRLYGGELYGFTLHVLGDRGAAEEIVEEVFLRAWRHAARYDPERQAVRAGIGNVQWLQLRAEELPAGLGAYRVISFAQSFHWMDQLPVARTALSMLEDGGACVHVHASTHRGIDGDAALSHPRPPRPAIDAAHTTSHAMAGIEGIAYLT